MGQFDALRNPKLLERQGVQKPLTLDAEQTLPNKLSDPSNAAPEWQAEGLGWHSRKLVVACPLKELVVRSGLALNDGPSTNQLIVI
jgi:hypothetical protein